jgi:hypothetical protein
MKVRSKVASPNGFMYQRTHTMQHVVTSYEVVDLSRTNDAITRFH